MAKTEEELNELRQRIESLSSELSTLTEEELKAVTGGGGKGDSWGDGGYFRPGSGKPETNVK